MTLLRGIDETEHQSYASSPQADLAYLGFRISQLLVKERLVACQDDHVKNFSTVKH